MQVLLTNSGKNEIKTQRGGAFCDGMATVWESLDLSTLKHGG